MSLPRTLEPEVMDDPEEAALYELMDHQTVNHQFVDDLLAGGTVGPRVIDLGCGPAEIVIELCRRDESVEVLAIDLAVEMLEIAKRNIDIAGLLDRIALEQSDAKSMPEFHSGMADTVISNSLLHHLPDPAAGLETAVRLTAPGGRLFFRDLARPESSEEVERLVEQHAGGESEAARALLHQSLHAALTLEEVRELGRALGIGVEHVQMTSDRHWTLDWHGAD